VEVAPSPLGSSQVVWSVASFCFSWELHSSYGCIEEVSGETQGLERDRYQHQGRNRRFTLRLRSPWPPLVWCPNISISIRTSLSTPPFPHRRRHTLSRRPHSTCTLNLPRRAASHESRCRSTLRNSQALALLLDEKTLRAKTLCN